MHEKWALVFCFSYLGVKYSYLLQKKSSQRPEHMSITTRTATVVINIHFTSSASVSRKRSQSVSYSNESVSCVLNSASEIATNG